MQTRYPVRRFMKREKLPFQNPICRSTGSGTDGKTLIILYNYRPGRIGNHPIEVLHGFTGMLQCDGYTFVLISPITITNPVVTQVSKDLSLIAHQRLCHTFYPDVLLRQIPMQIISFPLSTP